MHELNLVFRDQTECPTVVFTGSDDKPFEDFKPEDTPFSDTKVGLIVDRATEREAR